MNEKIKALLEQAKTQVKHGEGCYPATTVRYDALEKFADLIVRECINIVKPTQHHEVWAQSYLGGVDGLELLYSKVKAIKRHFGIEE
jgi:hypothetical protein